MYSEYFPKEDWEKKNCKDLKINEEVLNDLDKIIPLEYTNTEGIIIVKNGYIAYEKYFKDIDINTKVNVASITKSIISALIGIAIEKNMIKSVDEKVISFFPEYKFKKNKNRDEITIKHLLTMTTPFPFSSFNEPMNKMRRSKDWVKYSLEIMGEGNKMGVFKYSTAGTHILSAIITKVSGISAREFANKYLFREIYADEVEDYKMPGYDLTYVFGLGIRGWVNDPQGISAGGWGLTLSLRDMARFGLLYERKGIWNNEEIIPKNYIEDSIKYHHYNYGYLFWLKEIDGYFTFSAKGFGGNIITIIPEKNIVVAIATDIQKDNLNRKDIIKDYILKL
ncbi:serine hydrolase domain-containing protein [Peptoniphilus stercorisuis]|uniref:CubicO group peptidase (Beta-lactamase class C family) n=1 Tax=Peptoniphilus stercorisuis TaxID=1436965 RepID=A0ABS4KEF5_9FIRM|nr:serine hydrolase [Peptoniphilus stercorisuis]MBP2026147.1 CubicO group peptidase (beta-lactamase class C family) [Peptoniphilus stercorisuis]